MSRVRRRCLRWATLGLVVIACQACAGGEPDSAVSVATPDASSSSYLTVNGWEGAPVETFCLEANETYDEVPGSLTPFADVIELMLTRPYYPNSNDKSRSVSIAQIVATDCDATITLDLSGRALQGSYANVGGLYTGWEVAGAITLTAEGRSPLVVQVDSRREPPQTTREDRASAGQPADAIRSAAVWRDETWRDDFGSLFTCSIGGCPRS